MEHQTASYGGASRLNQAQGQNQMEAFLPRSYHVSFTHSLSIKLDEHNFFSWKHQVLASIKGSKLHKFLDSTQAPTQYLTVDDEAQDKVNPEFEDWEQHDNILMSWLLSSMSEETTNLMVGCVTTTRIWTTLKENYTALNAANISLYKTHLRNTKMTVSLNDYMLKIKGLVDLLATIGHKQSHQDNIEAIFNGLLAEYDVFVTSVTTRKDAYTVPEMEALLMAQSARIDKNAKALDISKSEANLAHIRPSQFGLTNTFTSPESFNQMSIAANFVKMQAYVATSKIVADDSWYPDTGATHHLTPDASNLASTSTYTGPEQVFMGNGTDLNIDNIGYQ
ncbi:uncharacterized protein LOC133033461 [Cannabis sativa]|uniref:uncharacterized protein LOC133033461 n=1 Tax=Cannabis sativa TaxID=3483 RepID=UPI0029CA01C1|nr:uncharacterized protein LOC133033461 [Cannabis sativa]